MSRRHVQFGPEDFLHVYNRGANRQRIFGDRDDYLEFLWRWRQFVPATTAAVLCYCLMPNHFHFLVQLKSGKLSSAMQRFGTSYVMHFNRRYQRTGVLLAGRYQAVKVEDESYLLHLTRYIHLNPVTAKLVSFPEDWEYSSYREYVGLRTGTLAHTSLILRQFSPRDHYRQFVLSQCSMPIGIGSVLLDD